MSDNNKKATNKKIYVSQIDKINNVSTDTDDNVLAFYCINYLKILR